MGKLLMPVGICPVCAGSIQYKEGIPTCIKCGAVYKIKQTTEQVKNVRGRKNV